MNPDTKAQLYQSETAQSMASWTGRDIGKSVRIEVSGSYENLRPYLAAVFRIDCTKSLENSGSGNKIFWWNRGASRCRYRRSSLSDASLESTEHFTGKTAPSGVLTTVSHAMFEGCSKSSKMTRKNGKEGAAC
jgi:hypothetical protein